MNAASVAESSDFCKRFADDRLSLGKIARVKRALKLVTSVSGTWGHSFNAVGLILARDRPGYRSTDLDGGDRRTACIIFPLETIIFHCSRHWRCWGR